MADQIPIQPTQPIQPEPSVSQEKPGGLKAVALIEVGLFELLFVVGGLLIIFGVLNYYNVLPISQSLPFLSFLPQQKKVVENKIQAKSEGNKKYNPFDDKEIEARYKLEQVFSKYASPSSSTTQNSTASGGKN